MDEEALDLNFYILAQPKAGSTWLVHLLSSFIDKNYEFKDLEKYIPITVKNYEPLAPYRIHSSAPVAGGKNILLIRNPLDSNVSWTNYSKLRGRRNRIFKDFSSYYRNISSKTLVIKYEDLNLDTYNTLTQIIKFLGWYNISKKEVLNVIDKCSLTNLREYEDLMLKRHNKFLFYDKRAQQIDNIRFYNNGKCYNFKEYLTEIQIKSLYNKYRMGIEKYWPEIKELIE